MDDLIADFLTETNESLGTLDIELIKLEQNPNDKEILSNIFRLMHTIKGTCGFLGLPRLESIAHAGENVLGRIRDGELEATSDIVSLVLEVIDRIRMIMVSLEETATEPEGDDGDLKDRLKKVAEGASAVAADPVDESDDQAGQALDDSEQLSSSLESEAATDTLPTPASTQAAQAARGDGGKSAAPQEKAAAKASSGSANQSIRVSVGLLESLMTMVSELVLTRNQLLQLTRSQGSEEFAAPLQRLNQVVSELQEGVMKTRMQPIENAWSKLPRLVRDLSKELGKKINLEMIGAETELDRQVLEMIRDPLTHMVRNSADHGLEMPDDRVADGKSEVGTITLNAYHEGGHIIIQIIDDGKGVNLERVKEKALANGLTTEEQLAGMTDQQICQFIFKPGFSTAQAVTSVSGRGVGMDVVRSNIEKIGGHVEVSSLMGEGSCFTIKIPLTLAIVPALIVESCANRFAIPQISVKELVRISENDNNRIEYIDGTPVLRLRDNILPLVQLREVLQLEAEKDRPERFIVIVRVGTYSFGILVDRILDTEEIVVKPVSSLLKDITVFSGNTILGDGSVVMILDPNGIASSVSEVSINGLENDGDVLPSQDDGERMTMLVFRSGDETPKAIPLSLVTRLEEINSSQIEQVNGAHVVQYRGSLMPLVPAHPQQRVGENEKTSVIVFSARERSVGLVVDGIADIVTAPMKIDASTASPTTIGTATIAGRATEIVNVTGFMADAFPEWMEHLAHQEAAREDAAVLLIDESEIFPDLLRPHVLAHGKAFLTARSLKEAAALGDKRSFSHVLVSLGCLNDGVGETGLQQLKSLGPSVILAGVRSSLDQECSDLTHCFDRWDVSSLVSFLCEN